MDEENIFIEKFYENSVIFITGGTGFLGKLLVEKLLRTFLVKKIYLLIRRKNNLNAEDRLIEFFKESVFDRLRMESPNVFDKVTAVHANFEAIDLNISDENKLILCNEAEIVFNIVASVKFNEKLRDAIDINVLGTKKILDLVMGMKHLKTFLHISTLYSNCNRKFIGEKVYESEIGYEKIIEITRILDDNSLEKMQHCIIGEMPNTYTMTKRCSENLVNHRAIHLPAGIFRPPIVLSTYKEPFPGWTDNLYGPSGLCAWTARGFIHAIHGHPKKKANLVPADYCVNAMIASAWDAHKKYAIRMKNLTEIPVYNYIYDMNNLTWGRYMNLVHNGLHEPLDKSLWYYSYCIIPSISLYNIANILYHKIPGYFLDLIAFVTGQKRIYSKGYEKIGRVIKMMSYFGLREWQFENNNIEELSNTIMNSNSNNNTMNMKNNLQFDMKTIDWNEYFYNYIPGIKKFFYKENYSNLDKCKKHYQRLRILHMFVKCSWWILLYFSSFRLLLRYLIVIILK